jgi:hypothetical protein
MKSNKLKEEGELEKQRGTKWQKKEIKREVLVMNRKYGKNLKNKAKQRKRRRKEGKERRKRVERRRRRQN